MRSTTSRRRSALNNEMIKPVAEVHLRHVRKEDLPVFFEHQRDPEASYMAAFTSRDPQDRDVFDAHWARVLGDPSITIRTIELEGEVAGNIVCFPHFGKPSVGYWIGKAYWGKGVATAALLAFLVEHRSRPLYAAAAADNLASIRVLEKCGFAVYGHEKGYANARAAEIDEVLLKLD